MNKLEYQLQLLYKTMKEAECICEEIEDDHGIRIAPWDQTFAVVAGMERLRAHFAAFHSGRTSSFTNQNHSDGIATMDWYLSTSYGTYVTTGTYDVLQGRFRFNEAFELTQEERDAIADDEAVLG